MDDNNIEKEVLSIRLRPFPGNTFSSPKHAWPTWSPNTLGCAIDSGPGPRGYIGCLLTPEAYLQRFGEEFVPTPPPGVRPIGNNLAEHDVYQNAIAAYNKEQRVMKLFRNKLINCVDLEVQMTLGTGEEMMTMTPREIYSRLERLYGTISATELGEELSKLSVPITSASEWMPLLGIHVTVHRLHQMNGQALGHNLKIQLLREAISNIGHFEFAIASFENDSPLGHNDRTFEHFVTRMNIAHSMIRGDRIATAASLFGKRSAEPDPNNFTRKRSEQYAGSATEPIPDDASTKNPTDGLELMRLNIMRDVKSLLSKKEPKPLSFNHYCWSHGTGNHDSKSCKHPKPGHVATASAKNKLGGSEFVYKKRENK